MFYVYVLKLNNGKLYFGYTSDLQRRIKEHTNGESTFTASCRPLKLVYYEAYNSKEDAQKREKVLKQFKGSYGHLKKRIQKSIDRK
ncbi:MAG: GIY-YIG nuclease family protein [Patescibacteria group bacterium]|jgi:putative endonuclease